jgi:hypothetical protein
MKPGKHHQTKHPTKEERKDKERGSRSEPQEQNPNMVTNGQRHKLCSKAPLVARSISKQKEKGNVK